MLRSLSRTFLGLIRFSGFSSFSLLFCDVAALETGCGCFARSFLFERRRVDHILQMSAGGLAAADG